MPNDGRWAAIEIKLGGNEIEEAASNFLKLKNKVDTGLGNPSFLMILSGISYAYKRAAGIFVVPITCLKDWINLT